jgi:P27 family predicted phage terminase small subunit
MDMLLVGMLVEALDRRVALQAVIAEHGYVIAGTRGTLVLNPAARLLRAVEQQIGTWLSMLGFTPNDRSRIGIVVVQRDQSTPDRPAAGRRPRVRLVDPDAA